MDGNFVQDRSAIGVDRFDGWAKWLSGFGTIADGHQRTLVRSEVIPNDDGVSIGICRKSEEFIGIGFCGQQSATNKAWVYAAEGDLAVIL